MKQFHVQVIGVLASLTTVHAQSADSWITTLWNDFQQAADCTSCQALLGSLKLVADFGETFMEDVLTGVCDISGAEDPDVCAGVIAQEGPAVHYTLKNLELDSHTANTLCASLVGLCDYPAVRPYNLSFPTPKPPTSRPPSSGQDPIKVAHFSDTHVDLSYEPGSNYACTKPICCRAYTEDDAPGNTSSPCGPWGNTNCDPPYRLQLSMMNAITDLNPAFSIYTGDVVAHDIWLVDKPEVLTDFNTTYGAMKTNLGLVYAALGNHDSAPVNLFPPDTIPSQYNPKWAYEALTSNWFSLTDTPSVQNANKYGSYSATHPNSNLRIISYNSIFYYKDNFFAYEEPIQKDPNNQLAWLIHELDEAESLSQRVWLISHIPSGNADHFHDHSHYLDQIINRYEATIAALFFGHTHNDEFQISYSDYSNRNWTTASAIGYIAPSMTPTSGPPSFRIYDIDPVTFGVLDYTQYIANISDPSYQHTPKWVKYYTAREAYGSNPSAGPDHNQHQDPKTELTPAFWHNVTAAMERDSSIFQDFWTRRTRGFEVPACKGDCVQKEICALRAADAQFDCVGLSPGFSFGKRGGSTSTTTSDAGTQHDRDHHPRVYGEDLSGERENGDILRDDDRTRKECNHAGVVPLLRKIALRARR